MESTLCWPERPLLNYEIKSVQNQRCLACCKTVYCFYCQWFKQGGGYTCFPNQTRNFPLLYLSKCSRDFQHEKQTIPSIPPPASGMTITAFTAQRSLLRTTPLIGNSSNAGTRRGAVRCYLPVCVCVCVATMTTSLAHSKYSLVIVVSYHYHHHTLFISNFCLLAPLYHLSKVMR